MQSDVGIFNYLCPQKNKLQDFIMKFLHTALLLLVACSAKSQTLEEAFLHPTQEARPLMIWQWMDGLVSAEGITTDLEAPTPLWYDGTCTHWNFQRLLTSLRTLKS